MLKRHLKFRSGASEKFWKINQRGSSFTVTFGRIGTGGQAQTKDFDTPAKAKAAAAKLVAEKLGKGYVDAGGSAAKSKSKGKPSARSAKTTKKPPAPKPRKSKATRKVPSSLRHGTRQQAMNKVQWKRLLKSLEINTRIGELSPVSASELRAFEKKSGMALPASYRSYCSVFGAGQLAMDFLISVPGYRGESTVLSLQRFQEMSRNREYEEYSPDPKQYARGVFFACDISTWEYFFDPEDVTNARNYEYAVYRLSRDYRVWRICDNFGQFVTEFCLGNRNRELFEDAGPPELTFWPAGK